MDPADRDGLEFLRALLAQRTDLALVVLFGSTARGCARPDSDLDVAVVPLGAWSAVDEAAFVDALERATGRDVDLLRLGRVDDVVLRREVARGVPLREHTPFAFARFAAEAALEWLDFEPVYLGAQARYLRAVAQRAR